ncbi:hypothetical protein ADL22_23845 [Streptomyces sp. NRRL F-4489]|uniref:hypothetical protein n=1 Tax=Streptomyces sp. NRRL F-4489 TaxID=1609095 RepID=UPI0007485C00|nr:hypothetical protein [Streptomyces sp. NRRL F-4489]KUL36917.1 hypothetical protein ADL22_23845 [Streptomyces sp. NRRL F-4489]
MEIHRPTPRTRRRLGAAAAVLAAVFASGWYLGQPLDPEGCKDGYRVPSAGQRVRYSDHLAAEAWTCPARPRAVAWFTGDFR